jgi:hypothetical protein
MWMYKQMSVLANFPPEHRVLVIFSHEALPRAEVKSGLQPDGFVVCSFSVNLFED